MNLSWDSSGVSEEQHMMTTISPERPAWDDLNPDCFRKENAAVGENFGSNGWLQLVDLSSLLKGRDYTLKWSSSIYLV